MYILELIDYHQEMNTRGLAITIKEPNKKLRYKTIREMHHELKQRKRYNKPLKSCLKVHYNI